MVKIRLSRAGAKGRPFYHVVVTDQRHKRDGRNIENIGYYNPVAAGRDKRLQLSVERVQEWVSKGAQLTDKVAALPTATLPAGCGKLGMATPSSSHCAFKPSGEMLCNCVQSAREEMLWSR